MYLGPCVTRSLLGLTRTLVRGYRTFVQGKGKGCGSESLCYQTSFRNYYNVGYWILENGQEKLLLVKTCKTCQEKELNHYSWLNHSL